MVFISPYHLALDIDFVQDLVKHESQTQNFQFLKVCTLWCTEIRNSKLLLNIHKCKPYKSLNKTKVALHRR